MGGSDNQYPCLTTVYWWKLVDCLLLPLSVLHLKVLLIVLMKDADLLLRWSRVNIHGLLLLERSLKNIQRRHTDCMIYNTENAVFEIRTFADVGKGGNVHVLTGGEKKCTCGKWRNYHMPCSHAIKSCHFRGIEPRDYISEYYSCRFYKLTYNGKFFPLGEEAHWPPSPFNLLANTKYERTEGVQHIAPSRMGRRCGNCKQTGHNRTRCPKNP